MDRTVGASAALAIVLGALVVLAAVGVTSGGVAAQATNGTNVTLHENPESVAEQGDSARLRGWLSARLTERLRESSIRISEGQYERADDVFDGEFDRRLNQYVDVAGDTGGDGAGGDGAGGDGSDSEERTTFEKVRDQQTRLAALRGEYAETYEAYLAAREAGNRENARLLARQLSELASQIRLVGGNLTRTLQTIENGTGRDTSDIVERIRNEVENVTETQQAVQTDTFRETRLAVATNRTSASFVDPVEVRGRLATANGTAVANRSVQVRVGHQLYRSTTGPNGTFRVAYRPAFVPVGASNVSVQYLPNASAPYLGTARNVSLSVERADPALLASRSGPRVSLSVSPARASYGERLTVETDLAVAGRPAVDVPVAVTVGPRTITETQTSRNGGIRAGTSVSAGLPPGTLDVRSRVVGETLAAGPLGARATLTVRETPTALTVETNVSASGVGVTGRLVGLAGANETFGIASQQVVLSVGGATRTVRTDASGHYETVLSPEALDVADGGESIRVEARFDGTDTNLESARARTRVNASTVADLTGLRADGSGDTPVPGWAIAGAVVLVAGVVVFAALRYRRREETEAGTDETVALTEDSPDPAESTESAPLADAREALAAGATDRAVVAAYAAARASLTDRFGLDESHTPRELLAACERHLDGEAQGRLQRLTDLYERTVFAPGSAEGVGEDAVEDARSLLGTPASAEPTDD